MKKLSKKMLTKSENNVDDFKRIGKIGEKYAIRFLIKNNYEIVEKNYNCNFGEIDIIAFDKVRTELVFIEVKTRTNKKYREGISSIDIPKQKHIYKTAEYYLYGKNIKKVKTRIDAIEVFIKENKVHIKQYKNIILEKPKYRKRI